MRDRLVRIFNFMDYDGGGQLSYREVMRWGHIVRGKAYTPNELKRIMRDWDDDHDGTISLEEWLHHHEAHLFPAHLTDAVDVSEGFGIVEEDVKNLERLTRAQRL